MCHVNGVCVVCILIHHIFLSLLRVYALDHGHAEEEQESLEEPAQAEEAANAELTEGKNWCIPPIILGFSLITTLC
jgi:hypothetical protein